MTSPCDSLDPTSWPHFPAWTTPVPWRLGVTSYIYPADILPNVAVVAGKIQDVELVFFESPDFSNLPSPEVVDQLAHWGRQSNLTYTVHFPIDRQFGSPDPRERLSFLAQAQQIIDLTRPLNPHAYLLHLEGIKGNASPDRVAQWTTDLMPLLDELSHALDPHLIALENLDFPFEWCDSFLERWPFSVCLDAGHFWLRNDPWDHYLRTYLPRTKVIHLYGINPPSTAHVGLEVMPPPTVRAFLGALADYRGVLTLETFGYDDTCSSMERVRTCLE